MAWSAPPPVRLTLPGHLPAAALATARGLGRLNASAPVSLALTLPLRNETQLNDLLVRLSDPRDAVQGQYLSPEQFAAAYSPTPADYADVAAYARSQGLTVTGTHANRLVLDVSGPAASVEAAFGVSLLRYRGADGRVFHAPDREPSIPSFLSRKLSGVVGLEDAAVWHPESHPATASAVPYQSGTGPSGGLAPSDIKTAYALSGVSQTGSGQTLGLFELEATKRATSPRMRARSPCLASRFRTCSWTAIRARPAAARRK